MSDTIPAIARYIHLKLGDYSRYEQFIGPRSDGHRVGFVQDESLTLCIDLDGIAIGEFT